MDDIPKDKWCLCEPGVQRGGKEYPPMAKKADWLPQWFCDWTVKDGGKK